MKTEDIENRIAIYGLSSRLMVMEVDKTFLESIHSDEAILEMFPNYRDWSKHKELSMDALKEKYYDVDFANLFLMHLVPYESFYTREDQMIESGGDNPVVSLYNALDFRAELDRVRVVSPDHIGVELEFMLMLCVAMKKAHDAEDSEGIKEILEIQKGFLRDHLLEWAPMFLINMKKESQTPLYHDGAELVLEFLLSDYEYVAKELNSYCEN